MKAPKVKTPTELLVYCDAPERVQIDTSLPATEQLKNAMTVVINNHGIYAKCYERQKRLVDSVIRRESEQSR